MTEEELDTLERLLRQYVATHCTSYKVAEAAKQVLWASRGVRGKARSKERLHAAC